MDVVFSPQVEYTDAERKCLVSVRRRMEEDVTMMSCLQQRLLTPVFQNWMRRDWVQPHHVVSGVESVQTTMLRKISALRTGAVGA